MKIRHRKQIRKEFHNYSEPGFYFVTICCKNRADILSSIIDLNVHLSAIGKYIHEYLAELPQSFPNIHIDESVIMPDHIHIIFQIIDSGRGLPRQTPTIGLMKSSLGSVINHFKGGVKKWAVQNKYNEFEWQRGYYDRIIRNEQELNRIRYYIQRNPEEWISVKEN